MSSPNGVRWIEDLSGDLWLWHADFRKYMLTGSANGTGRQLGHNRETIEELYGIDKEWGFPNAAME